MNSNWLFQSLAAMLLLIPAWLSLGFFGRNYHVRAEVFLTWYMLGVIVISASYAAVSRATLFPSWGIVFAIFGVGILIGGVANVFLFMSVAGSPNPGLPVAIPNGASIGIFLIGALLVRWFPKHFDPVRIDSWSLLGIVLVIVGVAIISIRK